MKVFKDLEQGSIAWLEMRLGKPTASEFDKIITPTGKLSSQARKYAYRLVAETLLNRPLQSLEGLEWIEHGKANEDAARKLYEFEYDIVTERVGFITTDDEKIGCSPDSLVGDKGMLEIKCPAPQTHVGYMVDGLDKSYVCQKQGQLYVAEREWVDLFIYNSDFPPENIRFYRDEAFISAMHAALRDFVEMKDEMLEKVKAKGLIMPPEKVTGIAEAEYRNFTVFDMEALPV